MFVGVAMGAAGPHPDDGSDPRFEESSYEFDPRDVRIRQDGAYDIVELPGSVPDVERSRLGQPQLPVIIKWFAIPKDSKVASVEVQAAEWTELPGRLLPPPIGWEDDDDQDRDSEYYASDRPFPPLQGFASRSTEHRGYYLAQVVVYPVRWDPLTGTALSVDGTWDADGAGTPSGGVHSVWSGADDLAVNRGADGGKGDHLR